VYHISLRLVFLWLVLSPAANGAQPESLPEALAAISRLGPNGEGHAQAMVAWKQIASADGSLLPEILRAMSKDHVLANNWLRAAVESIVDRELAAGRELPIRNLQLFLEDTRNAPRGREIAFDLVTRFNQPLRDQLLSGMLDDPSLELRRLAISRVLEGVESKLASGDREPTVAALRTALTHARDADQIESLAAKLRQVGEPVNLTRHFGFITQWHLAAPFDNTNVSGFDREYPPEKGVDLHTTYVGKNGQHVQWVAHTTSHEYGQVDLNKALDKHKGAVAYAYTEFISRVDRPVDLRLGSGNANKIWLNGEFLTGNNVYHSGEAIDQYITKGSLKKGKNQILLKICQNEQTEEWAQVWQFQVRVCDELGTAILSAEEG
jgi:hypothetical protein